MAFKMNESPHKRGEIQGTESASALKAGAVMSLLQKGAKYGPKAWQAIKNVFKGSSKSGGSKYHKLHPDRNTVDFMSDRTAKGGKPTGYFGVNLDDAGNWAFDPTKKMSGSPEDIEKIDEIVNFMNWKKNLK
jgi:hypothetical protein